MIAGTRAKDSAQGFAPLASLINAVPSEKIREARWRVAMLSRDELLTRFRAAHADSKRVIAFLMAEALVNHGVPPFVWHESLPLDGLTVNQRYDLFLADLIWLRRWYREHDKVIRYRRCKALLNSYETIFHREAEFAFYQGQRPAWKLVGSLSLTERQQWDCAWLRSTPIKKRAAMIQATSEGTYNALQRVLCAVRRTTTYGEAEMRATLQRRLAIWRCWRIVGSSSPTEIAVRFEQLTGASITRQAAAQQLQKVRRAIDTRR